MKKIIILLIVLPLNVLATDLDRCFQEAATYYNVSSLILKSIAQTESRMQPLVVNIAGASYYPKTKEEAINLINTDKSFDVGIMQVNRRWFERFGYEYSLGFDACWSIKFGAYVLAYEVSRHGWTWEAVGRYHSPTQHRKEQYINNIIKGLQEK
jgi:soluble lytic murein transglycosylase-like protein